MFDFVFFAEVPSFMNFIKGDYSFGMIVRAFLRSIGYFLLSQIYGWVRFFFNIFKTMANGKLLNTSTLTELFGRVGLILGVIMLFRVGFVFIQALIDPDGALNDKQKGVPAVIKKAVLVIIMFGMSTYVFEFMQKLQVDIINAGVIEKIILPKSVDTDNFGGNVTANLFTAFYYVPENTFFNEVDEDASYCIQGGKAGYLYQLRERIANEGDFYFNQDICLNNIAQKMVPTVDSKELMKKMDRAKELREKEKTEGLTDAEKKELDDITIWLGLDGFAGGAQRGLDIVLNNWIWNWWDKTDEFKNDLDRAETNEEVSLAIFGEKQATFILELQFFFSLAAGVMALFFAVSYCIQVGMRLIQLTVLQILSPVAFVGYLDPKPDNMFSRWLKLNISTYVDVFIRFIMIDFICYLVTLIMENWSSGNSVFWNSMGNPTGATRMWIGVFMIIALFSFAFKAPSLIQNLFPSAAGGSTLSMAPSFMGSAIGLTAATAGIGGSLLKKGGSEIAQSGRNIFGAENKGRRMAAFGDEVKRLSGFNKLQDGVKGFGDAKGLGKVGYLGGGLANRVRSLKSGVTGTYSTLKGGIDAGKKNNPVLAAYHGWQSGSNISVQTTNNVGGYLNQIDAAIKDDGKVKRATQRFDNLQTTLNDQFAKEVSIQNDKLARKEISQAEYNEWREKYVKQMNVTIDAEKAKLDDIKTTAYVENDKVQAAIDAARKAGVSVPKDFSGFKDAKDKQDAKVYRDYRPK